MDWAQLWEIASAPDNVPIVGLIVLVPFYAWYGLRQSFANDRLISQLEANPQMAKTHHRKVQPWKAGWDREVHVWPFLLRIEFLATIIVTFVLMVWSITLDAPLEEPANPTLTMNPSKAPWYFLGLQEMLVYFDPWMAGVVLPSLILVGLMAIPYMDANPLGNGYYTFKQRKFAILAFCFGFLVLWLSMVVIGTFIRGPGWIWFWPGQTWDHNRLVFEANRDLPDIFGITSAVGKGIFGGIVTGLYAVVTAVAFHKVLTWNDFNRKIYKRMSLIQYVTLQFFLVTMMSLPVKMIAKLAFRIKYVWVTPWFNI
ncbi:MAG: cytochrome C [Acidobacteria bacterium]|nr:cytochrome C [Acidobacteriota bacterium]MCI0625436.1 cytochrome C [Acidobacteriota bacterium]MCI0717528.1 cytochrome C [Acidobacteriota bacterium]